MSHASAHDLETTNRVIASISGSLDKVAEFFDPALDGPPPRDENEGGGSSREKADPIRIDILDARHSCMRELVSWVNFILVEVNDGTIAHGPATVDVDGLTGFIKRWVPSIVDQHPDDAHTLAADMGKHGHRLEALAMGWTTKRMAVGECPEQIEEECREFDGTPVTLVHTCNGTLWATIRSQDVDLPESVICDREASHIWSPWQWRDLGKRLGVS